jgi:hypothetical protein
MSGLCSPPIIVEQTQGKDKDKFVNTETQRILHRIMTIPLQRIQDECNKVANKYRDLWNTKNPNDIMNEYGLPITTYKDGLRELDPAFLLTCPSTIRLNICELYIDAKFPKEKNRNVASCVSFSRISSSEIDLQNPILHIFLPTLEVKDSTITWPHRPAVSFTSIIIHEFLHLCGEVKTPQRGIVDGVVRHTMIGTEAIEPLLS